MSEVRALDRPTRLVLVGSVIADLMMQVPALPERGGDVLAGAARAQAGGGFNVLAAAARLGLPGALAGHVGSGPMGDLVAAGLAREGVTELLPRVAGADTGLCVGFIEPDAERTFVTSVGVESELTLDALSGLGVGIADAVYVSGYDVSYSVTGPAVATWLSHMSHRPAVVFIDPGPLAGDIPAEVLDAVLHETTVLSLNVREVGLLGGDVAALLGRCARGAVVLERDGARGCTLWWSAGSLVRSAHVPAPSVRAVDSTGAGDAHAGAFLAALADPALARDLASGLAPAATLDASPEVVPLVDAVRVANAAAAYAVTMVGSATGPTRSQLRAFVAQRLL